MPRWMCSGSMICSPIFSTGLSEVIGSWKIMEMSRPRISRISSSESSSSSRPSKRTRALGNARRAGRQQLHDRERRYRFAGAGLADDGHHLAGIDRIAQVLDRPHRAVRGHELHIEVLDLDQRAANREQQLPPSPVEQTPYCRGSRRPRCSNSSSLRERRLLPGQNICPRACRSASLC